MARFIDPRVDWAFKRIFGSEDTKECLITFLNGLFDTELLSPLLEVLTGQLLTDRVEERIARVFERIRDVERHGRVVVVAAEGLSAVLVGAGAGNVGVTGDDAFLQTRDGGHHLKGGARR